MITWWVLELGNPQIIPPWSFSPEHPMIPASHLSSLLGHRASSLAGPRRRTSHLQSYETCLEPAHPSLPSPSIFLRFGNPRAASPFMASVPISNKGSAESKEASKERGNGLEGHRPRKIDQDSYRISVIEVLCFAANICNIMQHLCKFSEDLRFSVHLEEPVLWCPFRPGVSVLFGLPELFLGGSKCPGGASLKALQAETLCSALPRTLWRRETGGVDDGRTAFGTDIAWTSPATCH